MSYRVAIKDLDSGQLAVTMQNGQGQPALEPDQVLLNVEQTVCDVQYLNYLTGTSKSDQSEARSLWCSLSGLVAEVGSQVTGIHAGDRVSAIGPAANLAAFPAGLCQLLPEDLSPELKPYWALVTALVRLIQPLQIELGESVLVVGGGLSGHLVANLALIAGATRVIGFDPAGSTTDAANQDGTTGPRSVWFSSLEDVSQFLAGRNVDVLIDLPGNFEVLGRFFPLLRERGRGLLVRLQGTPPVDFDFYPNIHRQSYAIISGTLSQALQQIPETAVEQGRERDFVQYLLNKDRLHLKQYPVRVFEPLISEEQVLAVSSGDTLKLTWFADNGRN
jgi:NADPH:quinone reductase-like Zn-dependent oxidoreductase